MPCHWRRVAAVALLGAGLSALRAAPDESVERARVESEQAAFRLVRVADGLEHPWSLAFLPDGRLLVTERPGRLLLLADGRPQPLSGLPEISAGGQGGLLDVVLHPDYARNGWLYLSYSAGRGEARWHPCGPRPAVGNPSDRPAGPVHAAARGAGACTSARGSPSPPTAPCSISLGERNERNRAQDLRDPAGSVLRLTDDGRIPADNPFAGRSDALPEIWSYGHRNPQGLAVQPGTGWMWEVEHGPRGGDELNLLEPGRNYGWPVITYGREYSGGRVGEGLTEKPGMEQPVVYWVPSISPSGMAFYTGSAFPAWKGNLFIGALSGQQLRRLVLEGRRVVHQEVLLKDTIGRIRDVRQGPDGHLWLLTDEAQGALYRLEPAEPAG